MNLNTIFQILRKNNRSDYILHFISNTFSFAVISAYALLIFSPTVLEVLPVGGDSRKQAFGIFAAVCLGCLAFSFYASSLFFKKKQAELGIMIALGGNRKKLYRKAAKENLLINLAAILSGILLAAPLNKLIWGIMHLFIPNREMVLRMNIKVLGITLAAAVLIILLSSITLRKTLFSMDLMDVLKSEHKNEMVKKIPKHLGLTGALLTVFGLIGSYYAPILYMKLFSAYPPEWLNLLFLIPFAGIYLFLLHIVVNGGLFVRNTKGKKGSRSEKNKYKNMISKSMMLFQGKQTVNCLLVITLLIGGGCFSAFYTPVMMSGFETSLQNRQWNYQYEVPASMTDFSPEQLEAIITSENGRIQDKIKIPVLLAGGDGEEEIEDGRNFSYQYTELLSTIYLIQKSDYEAFTGTSFSLSENEYMAIADSEGLGRFREDLSLLTNMSTRKNVKVSYAGALCCEDLILNSHNLYVVNDSLYEKLGTGATKEWKSSLYFMKVENDSYETADKVYSSFAASFPEQLRICSAYDPVSKVSHNEKGETYWLDDPQYEDWKYLKENNAEFEREWKYYPLFINMSLAKTIRNYAVFLMLFLYVAIVALVAAFLIAYTRCLTIGMKNKYVFEDLEKLGASKSFRKRELKKQLSIIYKYPAILGTVIVYLFFVLILYGNDGGRLSHGECTGLFICFLIELFIVGITFLLYRVTVRKVEKLL